MTDKSMYHSFWTLQVQILNIRELMLLLQVEQSNLNMWSNTYFNKLKTAENELLEWLQDHIYRCLHLNSMTNEVKIIFCLALYIQQLLTDFDITKINLLMSLHNLQEIYMIAIKNWLTLNEDFAQTLNDLECIILQSNYYINQSNLCKIWLIVHWVVNLAQLLSL